MSNNGVEKADGILMPQLHPPFNISLCGHQGIMVGRRQHAQTAGSQTTQRVAQCGVFPWGGAMMFDDALGNKAVGVGPSTITGAGKGAFARRRFKAGQRVGIYKCQAMLIGETDKLRS